MKGDGEAKKWYTTAELCRALGVGRSTLLRWLKAGRVPRPVRFSGNTTRWSAEAARGVIDSGPQPPGTYTEQAARRVLRGKAVAPVEDLGTVSGPVVVTYGHRPAPARNRGGIARPRPRE